MLILGTTITPIMFTPNYSIINLVPLHKPKRLFKFLINMTYIFFFKIKLSSKHPNNLILFENSGQPIRLKYQLLHQISRLNPK